MNVNYPFAGMLAPGTPVSWQRSDQGQDVVIPWGAVWLSPGRGRCVTVGSDAPFPNGFGPSYPWIEFYDGPFAGHTMYWGHCTSLVSEGQEVQWGTPVAKADQGRPSRISISIQGPPGDGGWTEFGEVTNGRPGPYSDSGHWYDGLLHQSKTIVVPDPDPHGYHLFANDTWTTPYGKLRERDVVIRYDGARQHWIKYHGYLKTLRKELKFLADRCAHEAIFDSNGKRRQTPDWKSNNRGWRYQQLIKRSKGDRFV